MCSSMLIMLNNIVSLELSHCVFKDIQYLYHVLISVHLSESS